MKEKNQYLKILEYLYLSFNKCDAGPVLSRWGKFVAIAKNILYGSKWFNVFISCLDSHSDGTHSLQRIHWWGSDAMLLLVWLRNTFLWHVLLWLVLFRWNTKHIVFLSEQSVLEMKCRYFCSNASYEHSIHISLFWHLPWFHKRNFPGMRKRKSCRWGKWQRKKESGYVLLLMHRNEWINEYIK